MIFFYISNIKHLEYIQRVNPSYFYSSIPITSDLTVAFELDVQKIKYIDLWDLIDGNELKDNWDIAHKLSADWAIDYNSDLIYGVESLIVSAQQDVVYSFEAALNASTIYKKFFNKFSVKKIRGIFLPSVAVVRTGPAPTSLAVRSVSESVLLFLADKLGIEVERINFDQEIYKIKNDRGVILSSNEGNSAYKYVPKIRDAKTILVYNELMSKNEFKNILNSFSDDANYEIFPLNESDLIFGSKFCPVDSKINRKIDGFWNQYLSQKKLHGDEYPEIFSNKFLEFQFHGIKAEMKTAVANGDVFEKILEVLNPSVAIFGHDAFTRERVLVGLCQKFSIPTVGMFHGGAGHYRGTRGVSGRVDHLLVWNETDAKITHRYGRKLDDIFKLGSLYGELRYLEYYKKQRPQKLVRPNLRRANKPRTSESNAKILFLTAEVSVDFANVVASPSKHRSTFRDLISLCNRNKNWSFSIKPHPSFDYYEFYKNVETYSGSRINLIENCDLAKALEDCDVCVLINYSTTALVEAILRKVPVIYLDSAVYQLEIFNPCFEGIGIFRVKTIDELENRINILINDRKEYETQVGLATNELLHFYGIEKESVKDRFVKFINKLIADGNAPSNINCMNRTLLENMLISKNANIYSTSAEGGRYKIDSYTYYPIVLLAGFYEIRYTYVKKLRQHLEIYNFTKSLNEESGQGWPSLVAYTNGMSKCGAPLGFLALLLRIGRTLTNIDLIGIPFGYLGYVIVRLVTRLNPVVLKFLTRVLSPILSIFNSFNLYLSRE